MPNFLKDTLMAQRVVVASFAVLDEAGFSGDTFTVEFGGFSTTLGGFSTTLTGDQAAPPGNLPSFYTAFSFTVPAVDIPRRNHGSGVQGVERPH